MKLALHIGTPKTGTTSCQRWFAENRDRLCTQGVIYPRTPGEINHRHLTLYAQNSDKLNENFHRLGIHTAQDHDNFRHRLRTDLEAEIQQNPQAHQWVMSNEHLYSQIRTIEMIARLKDFLDPYFDQISIYAHLRPQVDLLVSNASQRARMGQEVSIQTLTRPGVSDTSAYFNYNMTLKRWVHVFGLDRVHLVPFRQHPDITVYLTEQLNIARAGMPLPIRVNESLGWRSMALVNGLGVQAADVGDLPQNLFLEQMPGGDRLQIGLELAREIQGRFTNSNTALTQRHRDISLADITPDWSRYDAPPNVQNLMGEAAFSEQMAYVVKRYRQELRLERARGLLAETELLQHQRKPEAIEKLTQARRMLHFQDRLPADLQPWHDDLQNRLKQIDSKG